MHGGVLPGRRGHCRLIVERMQVVGFRLGRERCMTRCKLEIEGGMVVAGPKSWSGERESSCVAIAVHIEYEGEGKV